MLTALLAVPLLVTALVPAVHANPHHAPAHSEQAGLHRRATYSCTATTDCTSIGYVLPANSHYYCRSKVCSYSACSLLFPPFEIRSPLIFSLCRLQLWLHAERDSLRQLSSNSNYHHGGYDNHLSDYDRHHSRSYFSLCDSEAP